MLQGTPIDMPFLDGFPPKDELPSITWTGKLVASLVRITLGSTRYSSGTVQRAVYGYDDGLMPVTVLAVGTSQVR